MTVKNADTDIKALKWGNIRPCRSNHGIFMLGLLPNPKQHLSQPAPIPTTSTSMAVTTSFTTPWRPLTMPSVCVRQTAPTCPCSKTKTTWKASAGSEPSTCWSRRSPPGSDSTRSRLEQTFRTIAPVTSNGWTIPASPAPPSPDWPVWDSLGWVRTRCGLGITTIAPLLTRSYLLTRRPLMPMCAKRTPAHEVRITFRIKSEHNNANYLMFVKVPPLSCGPPDTSTAGGVLTAWKTGYTCPGAKAE